MCLTFGVLVDLLYCNDARPESALPRADDIHQQYCTLSEGYRNTSCNASAPVVQSVLVSSFPASGRGTSSPSILSVSNLAISSGSPHPHYLPLSRLETFNGVLFNRLQGERNWALGLNQSADSPNAENPNLIYAILRAHKDFQDLATFTLLGGLKEIQRRMVARAQASEPYLYFRHEASC